MQEPTVVLSPDQIEFYHQNGYLALPAITTPEEIEAILGIYDRLFEQGAGREEGDNIDLAGIDDGQGPPLLPQILGPSKYAPELSKTLYYANATAIARQLLGPDATFAGDHAIRKPARSGAETPWHQDEAYSDPRFVHNSISIWMPLQEATLENGCMQFLPGSNRQDVVEHHSMGHDPRVEALEADEVDTAKAVVCPLAAGGATIHHCRTLHYTGPNLSDAPRRAYILQFSVPAQRRDVPRDYHWNRIKQTSWVERQKQLGHKAYDIDD
jgi:hypothetical protein